MPQANTTEDAELVSSKLEVICLRNPQMSSSGSSSSSLTFTSYTDQQPTIVTKKHGIVEASAHQLSQIDKSTKSVQTVREPFVCKNEEQYHYGYHFPSSPTPSLISNLTKLVQATSASNKQNIDHISKLEELQLEDLVLNLRQEFPTATEKIISSVANVYKGKRSLIEAALISMGYKKGGIVNKQVDTKDHIIIMMAKPSSKKLYDKLANYFPEKDERLIKEIMFKCNEIEYDIISALVETGVYFEYDMKGKKLADSRKNDIADDALMKVRYLKFLFPTCEEIDLYHLLYSNELKIGKVVEIVESRGHKRANVDELVQSKMSKAQQMAKSAKSQLSALDRKPAQDIISAYNSRKKPTISAERLEVLKRNIKLALPGFDDTLIVASLQAADNNEGIAKRLLKQSQVVDKEIDRFRLHYDYYKESNDEDYVCYPCKKIQTNDFGFVISNEDDFVRKVKDKLPADNKNSSSNNYNNLVLSLIKVDASTFTGDDFVDIKRRVSKLAKGPKQGLAKGRLNVSNSIKLPINVGTRGKELRTGSKLNLNVKQEFKHKHMEHTKGAVKSNVSGANKQLRLGPNPKLLERIHPFFIREQFAEVPQLRTK